MKQKRADVGRHKTGWPPPPLAQDDDRALFHWFAHRPGARRQVREAADRIRHHKESTR